MMCLCVRGGEGCDQEERHQDDIKYPEMGEKGRLTGCE